MWNLRFDRLPFRRGHAAQAFDPEVAVGANLVEEAAGHVAGGALALLPRLHGLRGHAQKPREDALAGSQQLADFLDRGRVVLRGLEVQDDRVAGELVRSASDGFLALERVGQFPQSADQLFSKTTHVAVSASPWAVWRAVE